MIIEQQSEIEILQEGESKDSIEMSLDMDSANILMNMLSKNLYSDAIGSSIRELTSNALDSHRATNKNDTPIIVSLKINTEDNYEFSVEDFGVGLDDNDVLNIISKYGKSTKRADNNQLGMFGLGFKVGLAYSSSFYFICRKNNVERKYMMYEGEDGNNIDLLYESPTEECNGVKVIIPVKWHDKNDFYNKIKEQLSYFENVFFDVYVNGNTINNDFSIYRAENYQFSELVEDNYMHLCLDNVYYPLDFSKLGINSINIPIGLRFGLSDGLIPVPSRESLLYSNKAKEIILNKIKLIADEFITNYNDFIKEINDVQEIFKFYNDSARYIKIKNKNINVILLKEYSSIDIITPKLRNISLLNLKTLYINRSYILREYDIKYEMYNNKFKENTSHWNKDIKPMNLNNIYYYIYNETISKNKKTYFRETLGRNSYYFVKKVKSFKLFNKNKWEDNFNNYYEILALHTYPKNQWRQVIKEFQYVQSLLLEKFINVDEFVIPQQWHDDRKKKRFSISNGGERKTKLEGEIICKEAVSLLRYNQGNNCKFVSATYKLNDLNKQKCLIVYTKHDKASKLDALYELSGKQKIKFLTFSDQSLKIVEKLNIHNLISYKKFMEGKNMPFKRIVTSFLISSLINENKSVFNRLNCIELISKDLYEKLNSLNQYERNHYQSCSNDIKKIMIDTAINYNLFDENIYPEYLEIKNLLEKLTFIDPLMHKMQNYNYEKDPLFSILIDMMKYHKQRIDYKHYNITLNEENIEILTEETIEELI